MTAISPLFLFSRHFPAFYSKYRQTHTHTHIKGKKIGRGRHTKAKLQRRCDYCPLTLLHYSLFICVFAFHWPHSFFSSAPVFVWPLPVQPLFRCVCVPTISYPYCPISCHPFTRPSSRCHHQGPGGDKGLYLGNAPSNGSLVTMDYNLLPRETEMEDWFFFFSFLGGRRGWNWKWIRCMGKQCIRTRRANIYERWLY